MQSSHLFPAANTDEYKYPSSTAPQKGNNTGHNGYYSPFVEHAHKVGQQAFSNPVFPPNVSSNSYTKPFPNVTRMPAQPNHPITPSYPSQLPPPNAHNVTPYRLDKGQGPLLFPAAKRC